VTTALPDLFQWIALPPPSPDKEKILQLQENPQGRKKLVMVNILMQDHSPVMPAELYAHYMFFTVRYLKYKINIYNSKKCPRNI
jgi:hypothetical protein